MGGSVFLRTVLDFFFPPLCHVCQTFIPNAGQLHICPYCHDRFKAIVSPLCPLCGIPFAGAGADHLCSVCITTHHQIDAARAAFVYEGPCRELIHSFKYGNKTHLRRPLAMLTANHLESFVHARAPELIIPVPLHRRRLRSRGFNQALLLGEYFSSRWNLPLLRHNLRRIRWTEPQVNLAAGDRRENVKGAFSVQDVNQVCGRRVLVVDDVCTTGSTVEECALVLKQAGATDVSVLTIARALA